MGGPSTHDTPDVARDHLPALDVGMVEQRPAVKLKRLAQASTNSGRPSPSVSWTSRSVKSSRLNTEPSGPRPSTKRAYSIWTGPSVLVRDRKGREKGLLAARGNPFAQLVDQTILIIVDAVVADRQIRSHPPKDSCRCRMRRYMRHRRCRYP